MPRCVLVRYTTLVNHPVTFHAALRILLLVTRNADNFLITWYETLVADWLQADLAAKALFMPLFSFVLILFHSCPKKTATSITPCCKVVVMAISAVKFLILAGERMID
jgi:hypothetical protein